MEKPWKIHGKNPWIPLKTIEHGDGTKFHCLHWDIFMLSMLAWDRKIVRLFPMKAWETFDIKPRKTMERMGIYKNESMESVGSMVFSIMLLLIISRKHEKHGKAWNLCK